MITEPAPQEQKELFRLEYYIGTCPYKKCQCRPVRITEKMIGRRQTVREGLFPTYEREITKWTPEQGQWWSPHSLGLTCVRHKISLSFRQVQGRISDRHICDSRCFYAKGHDCECSCGGANHGKGYAI